MMLDLAQYQITGTTAGEIAATTEAAIRSGHLDSGRLLPTVRALSGALGNSPATVSSAYRILRERGLIVTDGRRGTRVAPRPPVRTPEPGPSILSATAGKRDLALGMPDPELLPSLADAIARIDLSNRLEMSELERADPELLDLAHGAFSATGVPADHLAVTSGAFDAIERVLRAHLRPGDRVLVEDPVYTSVRDLLLGLGLVPVPVPIDDRGPLPDPFAAALRRGVHGLVLIPRSQNPFGAALDEERAGELREALAEHPDLLLIEDDHTGPVSGAPALTLVAAGCRHWAVARTASKALHPDLRLAVLAGDETTIARVEGLQALGPGWVSHVLQAAVVAIVRDPAFEAVIARAREAYASRRQALLDALAERGITAHGRSGLNVWVPVREEAPVIRALSDTGWIAQAGERFRIHAPPAVRVTIATLLESEAAEVAEVIAAVEHGGRPRREY
jgi:DNA-binding transcriptional MocR family regulator